MKGRVLVTAALIVGAWTQSALAQPPDVPLVERRAPNVDLIVGGASTFGIMYGASIAAAAVSDLRADDNLYIPLVGPWIDLANRPSCIGNQCASESGYVALIVADGVLQAGGALLVAGGFIFQKKELVPAVEIGSARVNFTPVAGARTLGLAAHGAF